jgi:hypothetical protein
MFVPRLEVLCDDNVLSCGCLTCDQARLIAARDEEVVGEQECREDSGNKVDARNLGPDTTRHSGFLLQ